MPIKLELLSVIVPVEVMTRLYGSATNEISNLLVDAFSRKAAACDGRIFAFRVPNLNDGYDLVKELELDGCHVREMRSGLEYWDEAAIVHYFSGPTLPCDWLTLKNGTAQHIVDTGGVLVHGSADSILPVEFQGLLS